MSEGEGPREREPPGNRGDEGKGREDEQGEGGVLDGALESVPEGGGEASQLTFGQAAHVEGEHRVVAVASEQVGGGKGLAGAGGAHPDEMAEEIGGQIFGGEGVGRVDEGETLAGGACGGEQAEEQGLTAAAGKGGDEFGGAAQWKPAVEGFVDLSGSRGDESARAPDLFREPCGEQGTQIDELGGRRHRRAEIGGRRTRGEARGQRAVGGGAGGRLGGWLLCFGVRFLISGFCPLASVLWLDSGLAADEADEHALAGEVVLGVDIGVAFVGGAEHGFAVDVHEAFEGGGGFVDEGGDDVAGAGLAAFEHGEVSIEDMGFDHGIAADAQGPEGEAWGGRQPEDGGVDAEGFVGRLFLQGREAGGDAAVDGQFEEVGLNFPGAQAPGAIGELLDHALGGEGAEVAHDGVLAGELKLPLDSPCGGGDAVGFLEGAEEIEDGLLALGQHTVHLNSKA